MNTRGRQLESASMLHCSLALWSWASNYLTLCLGSSLCKMGKHGYCFMECLWEGESNWNKSLEKCLTLISALYMVNIVIIIINFFCKGTKSKYFQLCGPYYRSFPPSFSLPPFLPPCFYPPSLLLQASSPNPYKCKKQTQTQPTSSLWDSIETGHGLDLTRWS